MNSPDMWKRYWESFQEALDVKVSTLEWNLLQPLKVVKHGLHWVVLFQYLPGAGVKFYIFETWSKAFSYALQIADALRRPFAPRYARPV